MEDFRFLQDNSLWIVIIAIFVLLFLGNNNGCNSFGDNFGGLFNGCGNNTWLWILIIILAICLLSSHDCGIFRSDLQ